MASSHPPRSGRTAWLWQGLLALALAGVLLPVDPDSPLASPDLAAGAYPASLADQLYQFIKAAMLWVPLGLLAGLAGQQTWTRRLAMAGVAGLALIGLPFLDAPRIRDLLEILYALPGLALGLWAGGRTRLGGPQATLGPALALSTAGQALAGRRMRAPAAQGAPGPGASHGTAGLDGWGAHVRQALLAPPGATVRHPLGVAFGLLLLGAVCVSLAGYPRFGWALGLGLAAYAALLWARPAVWLIVVPAALPLLDLAPWTGRLYLDEFDLLLLATAGVLYLRGRPAAAAQAGAVRRRRSRGRGRRPLPPLLLALTLLFAVSLLVGLARTMLPLPPLDANAFSSYWSPYNALRVAKGLVWGWLVFHLIQRGRHPSQTLAGLLALGMALGLLGVGAVGLWERWLYTGLADGSYRIVATFSSMHTGGGHIEAWLVAALPFLWLGMRRPRDLLLSVPLLGLSVFVLLYTVSRGGVLAFGLALTLLALASLRTGTPGGPLLRHAPLAVLVLAAGVLASGLGGGYFQKRLAAAGEDWGIRMAHWERALDLMDEGLSARLFGMGPGSFPRVWLERGPVDRQIATYSFAPGRSGTCLRLGAGETLYYAQRVPAVGDAQYRLLLDARSPAGPARLETPLCEKQLLDSRRCVWGGFDIPGDGRWHRLTRVFASGEVGRGGPLGHLPVEISLHHAGRTGVIEVDNVQLVDASGRDLVCNGDFERGAECWFFKTHSHLPWHIKNLWVHLLFEQGWLGLAAFLALTLLALVRLARAAWGGERSAWVLLAALAGLLTVGVFDSLLDAPRIATLLVALLLLGGSRMPGEDTTGGSQATGV